ncbi:hypothetical protein HRR78_006088 [Exophiala dermatitidis]|nr:hypothetical protein HRR75_006157 [Exophiala dermatitidis]KAJ4545812.1 hypothetical protein HRR78_006088 [Exophiala dermatitidis]
MVLLIATPRILDAISSLSPSERSSLPSPLPTTPGSPIEHASIIALARLLSRSHSQTSQTSTHLNHGPPTPTAPNNLSLNTLLRGAHVYIPPPPPKPQPSPEYMALMARLRKDQERREQKHSDVLAEDDEDEDATKDDISPSLVLNILLSVVMCACAMFYLTRWWGNDGLRVLVSLFSGIIVGVSEVTVYAGYLRKVRLSKHKERAKREKKVFIGEYRGGEEKDSNSESLLPSSAAAEKEEIWGRGVNGGMRRRLRDKWKKEQEQEQKQQAS